jgi:hypothetical protein
MDKTKVKIGQRVTYKARTATGTGKVAEITHDANGSTWVVVEDTTNKLTFKLRPSQIERA